MHFSFTIMKEYYYAINNEQFGPFTLDELKSKGIKPDTLIWKRGLTSWHKAETLEELQDLFPPTPPSLSSTTEETPPPLPAGPSQPVREEGRNYFGLIATLLILALIIGGLITYCNRVKERQEIVQIREENREVQDSIQQVQKADKLAQRKKYLRSRVKDYFTITRAPYETGFLGGISKLFITVRNRTEFRADSVTVVVRYIKSNGEVFKREYVKFPNLPARDSMTIQAPDSRKGKTVETEIYAVYSRTLSLCYTQARPVARKSPDPYLCE